MIKWSETQNGTRERDTHIQNKVEADWNSIRERWCCAVKNSGGGGG